jgi:SAM-dependent methyltransferase
MSRVDDGISSTIGDVTGKVTAHAKDLQPWDGYFAFRSKEMEALLNTFDFPKQARILEIGCANGFNTCLLSGKAGRIVATDLFTHNIKTHSQGMEGIKKMFRVAGVGNHMLAACSGEELPFGDSLFDMVVMLNTLEHIPDKMKALQEARRVLKKDGTLIVTVPNFFSFIFYPMAFYKNACFAMCRKIFSRSRGRSGASASRTSKDGGGENSRLSMGESMKSYPHFPFPEPHGAYATYWHELISYIPWNWVRSFEKAGFKIERTFATIIMPWHFLCSISAALPIWIYRKTALREAMLGRRFPMKYFGTNFCVIAKKP